MRFAERILGIASTFVLARLLLLPADYGIVGMAMVVIAFIETLTSMGVDAAIISKPNPDRADYDTAWTINAVLGAVLWLLISAAAVPAALYFQTPDVQPVLFVLALMPLIGGFENIGTVDFRRNLQFDRDVLFTLSKRLVALVVTIPLAFLWRNHWALVAGMVAGRIAGLGLSYIMSPYRPVICLVRAREMFHFSKWLLVSNVLMFFRVRSAELLTGRLHGAAALGVFNMSSELATIPSSELVMPINRALFPGYSQVSQEPERLRSGFLKALGLVSLLSVPASIGLVLVAEYAVPLLLGGAWLATIPVIKILALSGVSTALQINNWSVFLAMRRPDVPVLISLVHIAVLVATMFYFVPLQGATGAALAHLSAGVASLPLNYLLVQKVLGVRIASVLGVVWRPIAGSAAMFLLLGLLMPDVAPVSPPMQWLTMRLLETVALGMLVYAASLLSLWLLSGRPNSAEWMVLRFIRDRHRHLFRER
jgi:O-antigen/teichoic acid export membrane protein